MTCPGPDSYSGNKNKSNHKNGYENNLSDLFG